MRRVGIALKGFTLDKNGDLVRSTKRISVSERIRRKKSKRVKPMRGKRFGDI
jgi:hypothetical protein